MSVQKAEVLEAYSAERVFKGFEVASCDHAGHGGVAGDGNVAFSLSEGVTDVEAFRALGFNEEVGGACDVGPTVRHDKPAAR